MPKIFLGAYIRMEIAFNYTGIDIIYPCNDTKETFNDIFHKLRNDVDINTIIFLYSGNQINGNISINKIISKADLERNKMNIIVMDKEKESESVWIKSKDIICPKCGECAKLEFLEYIILLQCKKNHHLGYISLNEYEGTQKIDIAKIICDECKKNNKAKSYKNIFYRCNECNKNLCISCKEKHQKQNQEHNFINYDDKNYICNIHNFNYSSYCKKCEKNICLYCVKEHKEHGLINYMDILPDINQVKINLNKLKNDINKFKEIIDDFINKLNQIKNFIDNYYQINNDIYNILKNKYINYELLYSYNQINKSNIINDINEIINNEYKKINEIYNKMQHKKDLEKMIARKNGFILFGKSGSGKSTLLNAILGEDIASAKRSSTLVTQETTVYYHKLKNGQMITILDTPGLIGESYNDTNIKNEKHLFEIKKKICDEKIEIKGIIFLLNFQTERFDSSEQEALIYYNKHFGLKNFWKHLIIVFTHCFSDPVGDNEEEMKNMRDKQNKKIIASIMEKDKNISDVINCNDIVTKYFNSYSPAKITRQKIINEKNREELEIILDEFNKKEPLNNYAFKEKNEYY